MLLVFLINTALGTSSYWTGTPIPSLNNLSNSSKLFLILLLFSSLFIVSSTLVLMANLNKDTLIVSSRSLKHQLIQDFKHIQSIYPLLIYAYASVYLHPHMYNHIWVHGMSVFWPYLNIRRLHWPQYIVGFNVCLVATHLACLQYK